MPDMHAIAYADYSLSTLQAHHSDTAAHSLRVADLITALYPDLDQHCWLAGACHDTGKRFLPARLLSSPERPTAQEWTLISRHPKLGAGLLEDHFGVVPRVVQDAIRYHHEKWDGSGYPYQLAGRAIPWIARLVALIDAYDAMTDLTRVYYSPKTPQQARAILLSDAGTHFCPTLARDVEARLRALEACAPRSA